MPVPPLSYADYDAIRKSIDLSLDSTILTDAVIDLPPYLPAATDWLLGQVPDAASRTSQADENALRRALIAYAAYLLVPAVPAFTAENVGGEASYTRKPLDGVVLRSSLLQRAEGAIAVLAPSIIPQVTVPRVFTVASGTRGR